MEVDILVEGEGLPDVTVVRRGKGGSALEIVKAVAEKGGFPAAEAFLFVEDHEEPIDPAVIQIDERFAGKIHHVHRARQIKVSIFYNNREIERSFSPATRLQRILDWAVSPAGFGIDPSIAPEMELALHGETAALPKESHLGRYVKHPRKSVSFDLIRGVVPNGDS